MAYNGYLIRLIKDNSNWLNIPLSAIKINTYQVTWESQDYSAYRDGDGLLHRTPIKSRPPKVEFQVRNGMTGAELNSFMQSIKSNILDGAERKYKASIYVPEINDYITDEVYMVDPTFSINRVDGNTVYYNSFRMAFIGYGTSGSWVDV